MIKYQFQVLISSEEVKKCHLKELAVSETKKGHLEASVISEMKGPLVLLVMRQPLKMLDHNIRPIKPDPVDS